MLVGFMPSNKIDNMIKEIVFNGDHLVIQGHKKDLYSIPYRELNETKSNDKYKKYSSWVVHLSRKTWMNKESLYKLAIKIKELCPNDYINWIDTFVIIEESNYTDTIVNHENIWDDNSETVFPRDINKMNQQLKLESDLTGDKGTTKSLKDGVTEKLKSIRLID